MSIYIAVMLFLPVSVFAWAPPQYVISAIPSVVMETPGGAQFSIHVDEIKDDQTAPAAYVTVGLSFQQQQGGTYFSPTQVQTDGTGNATATVVAGSAITGISSATASVGNASQTFFIFQIVGQDETPRPHAYAAGLIDTYNGQYSFTVQDFSIPGLGFPLEFSRNYNSPMALVQSPRTRVRPFGTIGQWTHDYNSYVTFGVGAKYLTVSIGATKYAFKWKPGSITDLVPTEGIYADLVRHLPPQPPSFPETVDNHSTWELIMKDGTKYYFEYYIDPTQNPDNPFIPGLSGIFYMLSRIVDRNGNTLMLNYFPGTNRLQKVTDPLNRSLFFTYELGQSSPNYGLLTSVVYDKDSSLSYTFNYTDGDLTGVAGPENYQASYAYDYYNIGVIKYSRLKNYTDPHAPKGAKSRSFTNSLVQKPGFPTMYFTTEVYDGQGAKEMSLDYSNLDWTIMLQGETVVNVPVGTVTMTSKYAYTGGCWVTTTQQKGTDKYYSYYTWDGNFNQLSVINARGYKTAYEYDGKGNRTKVTNWLGQVDVQGNGTGLTYVSTFTYDTVHYSNLTSKTDANGIITRYNYTDATYPSSESAYTQLRKVTAAYGRPEQQVTYYSYDSSGRRKLLVNGNAHQTHYTYDSITGGLSTVAVDEPEIGADTGGQLLTRYTYDVFGRRDSMTDAAGLITRYDYDMENQLRHEYFSDGTQVEHIYDINGNQTDLYDAKRNRTHYDYDNRDRLTGVSGPENAHVSYAYDNANRKTDMWVDQISPGDKKVHTSYTYDELGRLISTNDSVHPATIYTYDAVGNLGYMKDGKGQEINYVYDGLNRLTSESPVGQPAIGYNYDKVGNRVGMADSIGTTGYSYDGLNRVTEVQLPQRIMWRRNLVMVDVDYQYDSAGNRKSLTVSGVPDLTTSYKYYYNNLLKEVTDGSGTTKMYYDRVGNIMRQEYPNKVKTYYQYDYQVNGLPRNHRLKKIDHKDRFNSTISFFEYNYDEVGNRTWMRELVGRTDYAYDNLYRLTNVSYPGGRRVQYTYDLAGNRSLLTETIPDSPGNVVTTTTSYNYDSANQMLNAGGVPYGYDGNGNQWHKGSGASLTSYTYDVHDQLVNISYPAGKVPSQMKYDGDGKRVQLQDGRGTARYIYDGGKTVAETDESGNLRKIYFAGVAMKDIPSDGASSVYYYLYDALGSVVNITDKHGNIVQIYYYDAFGKSTNVLHDPVNKKQFTGKEWDEDSELFYFGARYYDPIIGRWITRDSKKQFTNLYMYCKNNPLTKKDIDGFWTEDVHYKITLWEAVKVGIDPIDAIQLASVCRDVDKNIPEGLGLPGMDILSHNIYWDTHFPKTFEEVKNRMEKAIETGDIESIGVALHTLQDYYSHKGYRKYAGHLGKLSVDIPKKNPKEFILMVKETRGYLEKIAKKLLEIKNAKPVSFKD